MPIPFHNQWQLAISTMIRNLILLSLILALNNVMTLLRYDPGAFINKTMYSTGTDSFPVWVAVGDLNNDGWLDFVVTNGGHRHYVGVFLGLGNGIPFQVKRRTQLAVVLFHDALLSLI